MSTSAAIDAPQPLYTQLARAILQDIESGRYAIGELMPTEAELRQTYGLSRHTVREAIRLLAEQGLLSKRAGIGTRVVSKEPVKRHMRSITSVAELTQDVSASSQMVLEIKQVAADQDLSELLECKKGQRWNLVAASRFTKGDAKPIAYSEIYINPIFAQVVPMHVDAAPRPLKEPFFRLVEKIYGERPVEVRQKIFAVGIPAKIAKILGVKARSPGLVLQRQYFGADGRLIEMVINTHPADRFTVTTRLSIDAVGY